MDTPDIPQVHQTVSVVPLHRGKGKERRDPNGKHHEEKHKEETEIREKGDHVDLTA